MIMNKTYVSRATFLFAVLLLPAQGFSMAIDLGTASQFGALAGSGITFGASGLTQMTGDIGSSPTATITGLANLILSGENHLADATTQQGKVDLATAYATAATMTPTILYGAIFDLGGRTLIPGVYNGSSSLGITGNLTLDGQGNAGAIWIFQAGSTLITGSGSKIILINGASSDNIIWQVGSSATLNTGSEFAGTILAQTSISLASGATVMGRLLAQDGAVTFDNNTVMVPEAGTFHLFGLGLVALLLTRRRISDCL
jgi:Ice-binding-like